ncbi:hypothetical protein [Mesorhizobium sp. M0296]|uniref:hypothetical protein n=1 Tax=Mesorhizobium sp. M0296 TaxID=2956931 RepID=UPI00333D6C99
MSRITDAQVAEWRERIAGVAERFDLRLPEFERLVDELTKQKDGFADRHAEFAFLRHALHIAAAYCQAVGDAIPQEASIRDEGDVISAASAPAFAIAEAIVALPARDPRDAEIQAKAIAWLDGRRI